MTSDTVGETRPDRARPRGGRGGGPGFTLLELIVVLALLAVITASIVPVYVRAMNGIRMRSAQNGLIGTLRFIQELSVRESREYRLYVDAKRGVYWVKRLEKLEKGEKKFEPVAEAWGAETELPAQFVITNVKARKERGEKALFISCQPNGASDQATITLRDDHTRKRVIKIIVHGPMGKIEVRE